MLVPRFRTRKGKSSFDESRMPFADVWSSVIVVGFSEGSKDQGSFLGVGDRFRWLQ